MPATVRNTYTYKQARQYVDRGILPTTRLAHDALRSAKGTEVASCKSPHMSMPEELKFSMLPVKKTSTRKNEAKRHINGAHEAIDVETSAIPKHMDWGLAQIVSPFRFQTFPRPPTNLNGSMDAWGTIYRLHRQFS